MGFKLRREQDPTRMAALLDLSSSSYITMSIGFLWLFATLDYEDHGDYYGRIRSEMAFQRAEQVDTPLIRVDKPFD